MYLVSQFAPYLPVSADTKFVSALTGMLLSALTVSYDK